MKRVVLLVFVSLTAFATKAQTEKLWGSSAADSVKCWENLNIAGSYYQNKSYAEAYEAWYQLYTTCPGASKNTFIIAPKVIEAKIAKEKNEAIKAEMVKTLIVQYDDRLKYFYEADKEGTILSDKAADYLKYNPDDVATAYKYFKEAYAASGNDMYPHHLNSYFISSVRMFNSKEIELDALLADYDQITEALDYNIIKYNKEIEPLEASKEAGTCDNKCEYNLTKYNKYLDNYDKVQSNIEKMLAPVLSCDKLDLLYTSERFEANKTDAKWLKTALRMMEKERVDEEGNSSDCTSNPVYTSIGEALYKLEPSAQAARSIGNEAFKKKEYAKAVKYFEEAVKLEEDSRVIAKDLLKIAIVKQRIGSLSDAKNYALQAAAKRKNWGDPYLVLASIYADAAGTCGEDAIQKNAVYWAAIDKLNYAKSVDAEVTSKANKYIAAYKGRVPQKSTAFELGYKEGDKYTIGCWINESVVMKFY
jgi:tetratricopeptide (TPR) repeat protein